MCKVKVADIHITISGLLSREAAPRILSGSCLAIFAAADGAASRSPCCMLLTHNFASDPTVLRGLYAYLNDRPAAVSVSLYSFEPDRRTFSGAASRLCRDVRWLTWLLTLQDTMVAPCRLMVQVVLFPRSIGTTGTWAAIFVVPPFQTTVFTTIPPGAISWRDRAPHRQTARQGVPTVQL